MSTDESDERDPAALHRSFWRKLPRVFYWTVGGGIACGGAIVARVVADGLDPDNRYLAWIAGSALIFLGISVLSLGTHANLRPDKVDKLIWIALAHGAEWSG